MRVGFIGLGAMGLPMARNLLKAGFPLIVHDVREEPIRILIDHGAAPGGSVAGVTRESDVIITMLPTDAEVEEVLLGPQGVVSVLRPGQIVVDMSTVSPATDRRAHAAVVEKGGDMLDAPVSGGTTGAEAGTLTIMVGGNRETLERVMPVFQAMGKAVEHVGDIGVGQVVKMANQMLYAINLTAIGEAFCLAVRAGADPQTLYRVIRSSSGSSWALDVRVPSHMLTRAYETLGFALDLHLKDLDIAMTTARQTKVPLLLTSVAYQLFTRASGSGKGRWDSSAVVAEVEELMGTRISGS